MLDKGAVLEVASCSVVEHTLQELHIIGGKCYAHSLEGFGKLILLQLSKTALIKASEDACDCDTVVLLEPLYYSLNDIVGRLGVVGPNTLRQRHWAANVLEGAKLRILGHHSDLLRLQN